MKNNKIISSLLIGTCLITLASCGGDSGGSSGSSAQQREQQDDHGIYRAVLKPINTSVAGETSGTVEIRIEGDDVIVSSNVAGAPAGVKHLQNVTMLASCPAPAAEGALVTAANAGQILIPLDSNLSEQIAGMSFGPIANSSGSYVYKRSTSLTEMLADLRSADPDDTDAIVKLSPEDNLNLDGKVVIIHGVSSTAELPETVGTLGDLSPAQSLPIACGELVRITSEEAEASESEETTTVDSSTGLL